MKKRFLFLAVTFSGLSFLVIPKRKPEQAQADVCGEAARLPCVKHGKQQNPRVLSAAVPPFDESHPTAARLAAAYNQQTSPHKKAAPRGTAFHCYQGSPRPPFIMRRKAYIIHHMPKASIIFRVTLLRPFRRKALFLP